MSSDHLFLFEMFLTLAVVLGWCGWELWSLGRDKRRADAAAASAERPRHAEGQDPPHEG